MIERIGTLRGALGLALATAAGLALALCLAAPAGAAVPGCGSFSSQAEAQAAFAQLGGTPAGGPRGLDPDRDGVACETLGAPYAGYATIGFNRKRGFLYGVARMPAGAAGYQCLLGNRYDPETPRRLNVYRVLDGKPPRPILGEYGVGASADSSAGTLVWKANRRNLAPGRYYVAFEAQIRVSPFGATPCPGFASQPTVLPPPQTGRTGAKR